MAEVPDRVRKGVGADDCPERRMAMPHSVTFGGAYVTAGMLTTTLAGRTIVVDIPGMPPCPPASHIERGIRMGANTRAAVASLMAALMIITVGIGAATATGKDVPLRRCLKDGYSGGVKLYAKDAGKGAARVICPRSTFWYQDSPDYAYWGGERLDARNQRRSQREDVWNGFSKEIESLEIIELFRGKNGKRKIFDKSVVGGYPDPNRVLFELPRNRDNKATRVRVRLTCTYYDPCLFGGCGP